jgi:hypothetical protein
LPTRYINPTAAAVEVTSLDGAPSAPREEYVLTARSEVELDARAVRLNHGPVLTDGADPLLPVTVNMTNSSMVLPPFSYGFVVLLDAKAKACQRHT